MHPVAKKKMIRFHVAVLLGILLFPLYVWLSERVTAVIPGCLMHDWFSLYCPLCGGTRAVGALLRLDFLAALRYNAYAVLLAVTAVVYDVLAWIRLCRGEEKLLVISKKILVIYGVLLLLYWIARNVLLVAFHVDPLGDLLWFWNRI